MIVCGAVGLMASGKYCQNELAFPPVQLESTTAEQLAAGTSHCFKSFLLGMEWQPFFERVSKAVSSVNVSIVADSAAANLKVVRHLLQFLQQAGRSAGVMVTGLFFPCCLHQMARIVVIALEQRDVSSALFSITRLAQHSVLRTKTWECLKRELQSRFDYVRSHPPRLPTNAPVFRQKLAQILLGTWQERAPCSAHEKAVVEILSFFNGDLRSEDRWTHFCPQGCCTNKKEAQSKAMGLGQRSERYIYYHWPESL